MPTRAEQLMTKVQSLCDLEREITAGEEMLKSVREQYVQTKAEIDNLLNNTTTSTTTATNNTNNVVITNNTISDKDRVTHNANYRRSPKGHSYETNPQPDTIRELMDLVKLFDRPVKQREIMNKRGRDSRLPSKKCRQSWFSLLRYCVRKGLLTQTRSGPPPKNRYDGRPWFYEVPLHIRQKMDVLA